MASNGKRQLMACGHIGEAIVGQFYACGIKDCDGKRKLRCKCGSDRVEPFEAPPLVPPGSLHCWACGRVWNTGVSVSQ